MTAVAVQRKQWEGTAGCNVSRSAPLAMDFQAAQAAWGTPSYSAPWLAGRRGHSKIAGKEPIK